MSTVSKYADMAVEYLNTHGFNKGSFVEPTGAACTVGAIGVVQGYALDDDDDDSDDDNQWNMMCKDETVMAFANYLVDNGLAANFSRDEVDDDPVWVIADFNDSHSAAQVTQALTDFANVNRSDEM